MIPVLYGEALGMKRARLSTLLEPVVVLFRRCGVHFACYPCSGNPLLWFKGCGLLKLLVSLERVGPC